MTLTVIRTLTDDETTALADHVGGPDVTRPMEAGDTFEWTRAAYLYRVTGTVLNPGWYVVECSGTDGRNVAGWETTENSGRAYLADVERRHVEWQEAQDHDDDGPDYEADLYDHTTQGMTAALWSDMADER